MIAARELARGVWVAPAGVPLRGAGRASTPALDRRATTVRLFDAHANLVRQRPGSFSPDQRAHPGRRPTLLQLSVRRLLILLRKIALRLGAALRLRGQQRPVPRSWSASGSSGSSTELAERGALHAFRVVTDDGVNTADDRGRPAGRRRLQIAPDQPGRVHHRHPASAPARACSTCWRADDGHRPAVHAFRFEVVLDLDQPTAGLSSPLCDAAFAECDGLELTMQHQDGRGRRRQRPTGAPDRPGHLRPAHPQARDDRATSSCGSGSPRAPGPVRC